MNPGIYHMVGGGFEVDPDVTVTSNGGVLIFNDSNPYGQNSPLQQCSAVLVEEGARLMITPYGGEYEEVMIFQRRSPDPRTGTSNPDCSIDLWIQGGVTVSCQRGVQSDPCRIRDRCSGRRGLEAAVWFQNSTSSSSRTRLT
jgi:hypothetical protein